MIKIGVFEPRNFSCNVPNNYTWSSKLALPGKAVSNTQINQWLTSGAASKVKLVKTIFKGKSVTQNEFDALVGLAFNGGLSPQISIQSSILKNDFTAAIAANRSSPIYAGSSGV